jgi:hypothetical protein
MAKKRTLRATAYAGETVTEKVWEFDGSSLATLDQYAYIEEVTGADNIVGAKVYFQWSTSGAISDSLMDQDGSHIITVTLDPSQAEGEDNVTLTVPLAFQSLINDSRIARVFVVILFASSSSSSNDPYATCTCEVPCTWCQYYQQYKRT